jgi:hypothetical protein
MRHRSDGRGVELQAHRMTTLRVCLRRRREEVIAISDDDCNDNNDDRDDSYSLSSTLQFLTVICVIVVVLASSSSNFTCSSNSIIGTASLVIICNSNHRIGEQQQQQMRYLRLRDESATINVVSWEDEADYYLPPPGPIEDDDDDVIDVFATTQDDDHEDVMDDVADGDAGIVYSEDIGSKETPAPQPFDAVTFEIYEDLAESSHNMKDQSSTITIQENTNDIAEAEAEIEAEYRESRMSNYKNNNSTQLATSSTNVFDVHFGKAVYADTILDDLLHGFLFAAIFCCIIIILYNCCTRVCTRMGCLPDERVLSARLHRLRLRKKRMYLAAGANANNGNYGDEGYDEGLPPLDTRKWGEWMARRAGVHTAADDVWNDGVDTPWEEEDNDDDDDDDDEVRPLTENNGRVVIELEMAELEYGEGEELEDKSHDSRLFDDEDDGEGARREAERFFGDGGSDNREDGKKKKTTNGFTKNEGKGSTNKGTKTISDHNKVRAYAETILQKANKKETKRGVDIGKNNNRRSSNESQTAPISDDAFFSAMRRPTTDNNESNSLPQSQPSSAPLDDSFIHRKLSQDKDENNGNGVVQDDDEDSDCDIHEDDRGYDLENDLLGLRSDSPEPLDLEQIEKKLISDMENAKKEGYLSAR